MIKILILIMLLFTISAYASDISLEPLMNDVYDSTNQTLRVTITGSASNMTGITADTITARSRLSADSIVTVSGDLNVGINTFVVETGTDRVGINQENPTQTLGVKSLVGSEQFAIISSDGNSQLGVNNDNIVNIRNTSTTLVGGAVGRIPIITADGSTVAYIAIYAP